MSESEKQTRSKIEHGVYCSIFLLLLMVAATFLGSCAGIVTTYTLGGTVTGLVGTGLVLSDIDGEKLQVNARAASFVFSSPLAHGKNYSVTIFSEPSSPTQSCSVSAGAGRVNKANVTGIQVTCTTNNYTIGGTVTGLAGSGLVLRDNGGNDLAVASGATGFTFTEPIRSGNGYSVSVSSQPSAPAQTCAINNAAGVVTNADITNVQVTCARVVPTVFAYVTNQGNGSTGGSLSGYSLSPDGTLVPVPGSPFTTGPHPKPLVAAPHGKFLYIGDVNNSGIYAYAINATTGALTQVGAPTFVASVPASIAIHPSGAWLYAPSINADTINAFSIDPVTGALTALPGSPFADTGSRPAAITFDPSGQFAFVSNNSSQNISVFSVNPATGQLTAVGTPISAGDAPQQSITDLSGAHLYVEDGLDNVFYAYNIAGDGTLSHLSPPTFPAPYSSSYPALSPSGTFLYVPSFSPQRGGATSTVGVYSVDPASGALAAIGGSPFVTGIDADSIAVDPAGKFAYVPNGAVNSVMGYSLNSTTGAMSPLPTTFPAGQQPSVMVFVQTN